jgi:hypothetical protein
MSQSAFAINTEYEARATGYRGTAVAGTTTDIDFPIGSEDRYIDGLRLFLKNHVDGDTMDFKVVDVDGIIPAPYRGAFPSYPILKQFGYSWNVDEEQSDQGKHVYNFLARLAAGLYIRISYTSTGTTNVTVKLNARLYYKIP